MSTGVNYKELGTKSNLTSADLVGIADPNGLLQNSTLEKLQQFLNTIGVSGYRGALLIADTPSEDGIYIAGETGTFTNADDIVVDLEDTITFIDVSSSQTVFKKVEIPLSITQDETPKPNSNKNVKSGGVVTFVNNQKTKNEFPDPFWETDDYLFTGVTNGIGFGGGGTFKANEVTRNDDGTVSVVSGTGCNKYRFSIPLTHTTAERKTNINFYFTASTAGTYTFIIRNNHSPANSYGGQAIVFGANETKLVSLYCEFNEVSTGFNIEFVNFPNGTFIWGKTLVDVDLDNHDNIAYLSEQFLFKDENFSLENDSVTEDKLSQEVRDKLNADNSGNVSEVTQQDLTDLENTINVDLLQLSDKEQIARDNHVLNLAKLDNTVKLFFLDSQRGDDANDGALEVFPVKTPERARTIIENYRTANPSHKIYLNVIANSVFKREYYINDVDNLTVRKFGVGNNPLFDGSLELTTFALNSGNVYEVTVDYTTIVDGETLKGREVIFEDGVTLQPVATIAECQALAGSYVVREVFLPNEGDESVGDVVTMQFHPSDSGNPATNGKVYSTNQKPCLIAKPSQPLVNLENVNFEGIDAQYGYNATNFVASSRSPNSTVQFCNSNWGTKHNFHFEKNTVASDLIALESEIQGQYGRSATTYVCYSRSATLTDYMLYKRCVAIFNQQKNGQKLGLGNVAFLDHHSSLQDLLGVVSHQDCYVYGYGSAVNGNSKLTLIENCFFEKLTGQQLIVAYNLLFKNSFLNGVTPTDGSQAPQTNHTHSFENSLITNFRYGIFNQGSLSIKNTIFTNDYKNVGEFSTNNFMPTNSDAENIECYGAVFIFQLNGIVAKTGKYQGDYNIFSLNANNATAEIHNYFDGNLILDLSDWQTATGQDANSVYLTKDQQRAFLTTDPLTGDAIINPNAEVTDASGNVLTGVFPDGTKISEKIFNKEFSKTKTSILKL